MTHLIISRKAFRDLENIWTYTVEQWSADMANRYVQNLKKACKALANRERAGQAVDGIKAGYFRLHVGSHTLYYTFRRDHALVIERVLHQSMDAESRL